MQAPNHSKVTLDGDDFEHVKMLSVGMTVQIKCNERAKIMGNGSDFVVCQGDGTYSSLGRSQFFFVLYLCYVYWDLRAPVMPVKGWRSGKRFAYP